MSQLNSYLLDPVTPSTVQGVHDISSNLNQMADRQLQAAMQKASIDAQKELATAEINAKAKLAQAQMEHESSMQDKGLGATKENLQAELAQRNQEAATRLQVEKELAGQHNKLVEDMHRKDQTFSLQMEQARMEGLLAENDEAAKASREKADKIDEDRRAVQKKLAALNMAMDSATFNRNADLTRFASIASHHDKAVQQVRSAAATATQMGIQDFSTYSQAQAPGVLGRGAALIASPFSHEAWARFGAGSRYVAGTGPYGPGGVIGDSGHEGDQGFRLQLAASIVDKISEVNDFSKTAEKPMSKDELTGLLATVLGDAHNALGISWNNKDPQVTDAAIRTVADSVTKLRDAIGDPAMQGIIDALSGFRNKVTNTSGEGGKPGSPMSDEQVMVNKNIAKIGDVLKAAADKAGGLVSTVDVDTIQRELTLIYDKANGGDANATIAQLMKHGLTRPLATKLYNDAVSNSFDFKTGKKEKADLEQQLFDTGDQRTREIGEAAVRANSAGMRAVSKRYSKMLEGE